MGEGNIKTINFTYWNAWPRDTCSCGFSSLEMGGGLVELCSQALLWTARWTATLLKVDLWALRRITKVFHVVPCVVPFSFFKLHGLFLLARRKRYRKYKHFQHIHPKLGFSIMLMIQLYYCFCFCESAWLVQEFHFGGNLKKIWGIFSCKLSGFLFETKKRVFIGLQQIHILVCSLTFKILWWKQNTSYTKCLFCLTLLQSWINTQHCTTLLGREGWQRRNCVYGCWKEGNSCHLCVYPSSGERLQMFQLLKGHSILGYSRGGVCGCAFVILVTPMALGTLRMSISPDSSISQNQLGRHQ